MSKIICDICGTVYPDTADKCPICGYVRNIGAEFDEEEEPREIPEHEHGKGGKFSSGGKKNHPVFDFDAENEGRKPGHGQKEEVKDDMQDYEEAPGPRKSSTFLIIILVVAIVGMIGMIGFLFFRFFMPYKMMSREETTVVTTVETEAPVTEETTVPTIPCESLVMTSGKAELSREGQYWLIHAAALPENTTDIIRYVSADDSVAIVSDDGRITAMGEGETEIILTCGSVQMSCPVVVKYQEETVPTTEATEAPVAETEEIREDTPEETKAAQETEAAEKETAAPADVVLKLKRTDISFGMRGVSFDLELDCDLQPEQVKWSVGNPAVAMVDEKGTVSTIGPGTTRVYAEYEGQKVECIVRCQF